MPEISSCPACGRSVRIPEELHGRDVKCPLCQTAFVAGAPGGVPTVVPVSARSDDLHEPIRFLKLRRVRPTRGVALATVILLALGMVFEAGTIVASAVEYALLDRVESWGGRLDGTAWFAEGAEDADWYTFEPNGRLVYKDGDQSFEDGRWQQTGPNLSFQTHQGTRRFEGTVEGSRIVGRTQAADDRVWDTEMTGPEVPEDESDVITYWEIGLGLTRFLVWIPALVLFLLWFYRAHANLAALGARRLRYGSGWAVGAWFVPVLNLFRPYQIAQEIWRKSDPHVASGGTVNPEHAGRGSTLIVVWWLLWLVSNHVTANAALRTVLGAEKRPEQMIAAIFSMVADGVSILAGVALVLVIWRIERRQRARLAALHPAAE